MKLNEFIDGKVKEAAARWMKEDIGQIINKTKAVARSNNVNSLGSNRLKKTIDSANESNLTAEQGIVKGLGKKNDYANNRDLNQEAIIADIRKDRKGEWRGSHMERGNKRLDPKYNQTPITTNNNSIQLNNGSSVSLGKTKIPFKSQMKYQDFRERAFERDQSRSLNEGTISGKKNYTPTQDFSF